jgi:hypothetical protein
MIYRMWWRMTEEEKRGGERGTHTDNDLSEVQEIMRDNDLPFYNTSNDKDEEEDDSENYVTK